MTIAARLTAVVVAAGLLGLLGVAACADGPEAGKAPPEIKAEGWLNAEGPVTLEKLKGKVVVVEFWATWCPPCRKSIPHLAELHEKRGKDGLVIVGLSDESKDTVEAFAKKTPMPYIVGYGSPTGDAYGVTGIPTAFLIGTDGVLLWSGHPMDPEFDAAIDKALSAAGTKGA